jgi:hypothetical protein
MIIHCKLIDILLKTKYGVKSCKGINTTDGLRGSIPLLVPKLKIMSRTIKKAYKNRNIKRPIAKSCMNNGGCPYCERNRLHNTNKKLEAATYSLNTINK